MNREGVRVTVAALLALALLIAATIVLEWFVVDFAGHGDTTKITFDLREARACSPHGSCAVVPMSMIKGSFYPTLAAITFWGGIAFGLMVLYQAGTRVLGGAANGTTNESLTRAAHLIGVCIMLTAVCAGYVFGPDFENGVMTGFAVDRGWGPLVMLLGLLAGHLALYLTHEPAPPEPAFQPIQPIEPPISRPRTPTVQRPVAITTPPPRVPLPTETPPQGAPTVKRPATVPPVSRTKTPERVRPQRAPTSPMPEPLKGKIKFAIVTGEVTIAGIDARREDGSGVLVMWRDVVGLVVRRLPQDLEGHAFVDVVSTAGMTLRVLPWSKITGQSFPGEDEAWIRALVKDIAPRCTEAKLDRATQAFLDDDAKRPAQLSSELLAKHDQALA